jgi:chaperonin GroEL
MGDGEALLRAIIAAPGEDTPRLMFADWLEERGDPRAACFRLAARFRASYGPRRPDHSRSFWRELGRGLEPAWRADEARRLAEEVEGTVGDGCKTAVLVALGLTEAALLFSGAWVPGDPAPLRAAGARAAGAINDLAVPPTSAAEVGRCLRFAALGDEVVSRALLSAFSEAGRDGAITVVPEPGLKGQRARMTHQEGLRLPAAVVAGTGARELQRVAVLVSLRPLRAAEVRDARAACSGVAGGLLCLCPEAEGGMPAVFRTADGGVPALVCAVPAGRWRDGLEDVAAATGARPLAPGGGTARVTAERLGRAGSAAVEEGAVAIRSPAGSPEGVAAWVDHLRRLLDAESAPEAREWLSERLAHVTGGVVTVTVGAADPGETEQLDGLACGALHAGRAMIAEGYVPGAGVAYLRAGAALPVTPAGRAARWALVEPARALLAGSALGVGETLSALRADERLGLDAVRGALPAWREGGPIDPARVVRMVVECAFRSALAGGLPGG